MQKMKLNPENEDLKAEFDTVINDLTRLVAEENNEKIVQNFKHLDQSEGGNVTQGVWETLKKTFPTNPPTLPAAKINSINGRLVSDEQGLKDLHLETFSHRLRTALPCNNFNVTGCP